MKPFLFPYRVVTGSIFNPKEDEFDIAVFHMTFWAADKDVLSYLIFLSGCPSGRIYAACDVQEVKKEFSGPKPVFSPN